MARNTWALFTMCCLIAAGTVGPCEAGVSDPNPRIADPNPVILVQIQNPHGLEAPALDRAQALAREIYTRAGVSLRWTPDETMDPDRTLTVVLTSSTAVPPDLGSDAMGVAPSPGDGTRGTLAYVFLDKVRSFAAAHRLVVAHVLACALAHEIGHLLLPPNAHRPDSVMRDGWHPALFPPRAPGLLGFPPDQAKLLRLRARRQ
jgi:hypothetical protein